MGLLFGITLFTSAALLFSVQPMVAKMLLPWLGGAPAVWNICLVFFQSTLLAAYAYAHALSTRFSPTVQKRVHLVLMLVTCVSLPIGISGETARIAPWDWNPTLWLFRVLVLAVGLPFFTVSCSAPLLQSWFSRTRHASSRDPYFLYAASNLGSLVGLMAYPIVIESRLRLAEQTRYWAFAYIFLIVLFAGCAWLMDAGAKARVAAEIHPRPAPPPAGTSEVDWRRRVRWMIWALIPSSLMLGVNTYLTTDIASVPLLWTVPLAIYLLTFIMAFNRRRIVPLTWLARLVPVVAVVLLFVMLVKSDDLTWLQIGVNLAFFLCAALLWHTRLANDRPSAGSLTQFYFCIAVGGVLGGLFNALLAPVLFRTVIEYPLMISLACVRWPAAAGQENRTRLVRVEWLWPVGIGLLTVFLAIAARRVDLDPRLRSMLVFGVPAVLCYVVSKVDRAWPFALAVGAVFAGGHFYTSGVGRTLRVERNFFGTLRVTRDGEGRIYSLYHGTTIHGMQFVDPGRRSEPLAYYYRAGPCGQALNALQSMGRTSRVGVIGLGAGAMAAYARPGQHWTFYEIDPAVLRLAREGPYFTYVRNCTNAVVDFKQGDARLRLREAEPGQFDLLICDAFGSDAPPLHLLNMEAMELYLSKLSEHGVLVFHISSRYLDFRPVIGNLAWHFRLRAMVGSEGNLSPEMLHEGRLPSMWVVLARRAEDLGKLASDPRWDVLPPDRARRLWTDDYSNILSIFQWD